MQIDTRGCHACDVIVFRIADTGVPKVSRMAIVYAGGLCEEGSRES